MGLALFARGGHLDFVGEHRLLLRRDSLRGLQVEGDGEFATLIGAGLAVGDLLVLDGRVPPPPATPGERGLADDAIGVFHIVQAEAGISLHVAMHRHLLIEFVLLLRTVEFHLKGRALVFFHADDGAATVGIEVEHTVQSVGGDDEGTAERTVFVGGKLRRTDFLPVGIEEGDTLVIIVDEAHILTLTARHDTLEIDGLSGTVDGTVGEELRSIGFIVVPIGLGKDITIV